jgi:hypothetical protein
VPDDAIGRVDLRELVDPPVLVGVEEAVAEGAGLAVGHRAASRPGVRGVRKWIESRYSSMRVMRPSRQLATTQAQSEVRRPPCSTTFTEYWTRKPVPKVWMVRSS